MRILVAGSGPAGLMVGATLARRGHEVICVDRDPGPDGDEWHRRGVMQFTHAHNFRPQVAQFLQAQWPEAHDAWLALGAETISIPGFDDPTAKGVFSRRSTFERALRQTATQQPGLTLRTGHVDSLVEDDSTVSGVRIDGEVVSADLVVDASGRSGRVTGRHDPELDGECGLAYVDRAYMLRPEAEPGPMNAPVGFIGDYDGYQCLIFPHERGHFSVVIVRPTHVPELKALRHVQAFDAAARAIPDLAAWTDPRRCQPTSGVQMGGALRNVYRSQDGRPGLVAVGDSVATTTPTRGRGVAMTCMQVSALLELLDDGADPVSIAKPFGMWCDAHMEPWVADHIAIDEGAARRWRGEDIDLDRPLTSDLIAAAIPADPRIGQYAFGYFTMTELPESLRPAEPWARAAYETGWRSPFDKGPHGAELLDIVRTSAPGATV